MVRYHVCLYVDAELIAVCSVALRLFFVFKQKTAYEMRISDWSSDVCSSDLGKLIVYGRTREGCLMRLRRALEEYVIEGMKTTIPLHQKLLRDPEFQNGDYTIKWLEEWLAREDQA